MKVLDREELWIHTHFLTNCTSLAAFRMREIEKEIVPFLHELGIVYGIHFSQARDERTYRVVLDCIPFAKTLDHIQRKLQEIVHDILARPPTTKVTPEGQPKAVLVSRK